MNNRKILGKLIIVALLVSMMAAVPIQQTNAAATQKTYAISDAIPQTVGVGDEILLKCGITEALASQAYGWTGITIKVVKPDGTSQTLGPFTTDSTGSTYTVYVPDQMGRYNVTTYFPQQEMPVDTFAVERGALVAKGTVMLASEESSYFTVTEETLNPYPGHALPSEYWSRPIDPQLREWAVISGNWVYRPDNSFALYNDDAPETAHVLWTNPLTTGGLAGGLFESIPAASETGDAYEGKFPGSVILNGILYYQRTDTRREQYPAIMAVDLHTGEEWMFKNNTVLSFGQVFYFNSYNFDGVFTYIWSVSGSTYTAYDPFTGNQQIQITNVPSGTRVFGPNGEFLIYQINYTAGWMALWNSTDCGLQNAVIGTPDYGSWGNTAHGLSLQNKGLNGTNPRCYSWNVSIPTGLSATGSKIYVQDRLVGIFLNQTKVRVWALNLDLERTSTQSTKLYDEWWNPPAEWYEGTNTLAYTGASNWVTDDTYGDGVIAVWDKELTTHYGFSVTTGKYLWETDSEIYLDAYGWGAMEHTWYFAYGKLFSIGVGGILYAYDLKTGDTAWTYELNDAYGEPITGNNWWGWIGLIADGKVYIGTLEHSAENPLPRGAPFAAVNASNGAEIWRVNGMFRETRWGGNAVIGDSIIASMDTYDQRVYAIGKGPSAVTVTAPDTGVKVGDSITIKGTIMDTSPGTQRYSVTSRFPNGVPAVSDASMSSWMLYVYKQFERPTNITGVTVTLSVVDSNGNYRDIGTTTSDADGFYSLNWTPDIEGKYTLYASFGGSAGYYPSHAVTAFSAGPVAATPAPTEAPKDSVADQYLLPGIIAIIIAIVVGFAVTILMLRKRP